LALAILSAILLAAGVWLATDLYHFAHAPARPDAAPVVFSIAQGESFSDLTARMGSAGIIADAGRFKLIARIRGDDKRLRAGEYQLAAHMTPLQILDTLVQGKVILHSLTIPEGFTVAQVAAEAQRMGLADADALLAVANDPQTARSFGLQGRTLEGYLFPDTYHFPKETGERSIITTMVENFKKQIPPQWSQRMAQLNLTLHEVVTLASIIEKETGDPAERPLIASVFHNRLKKKMRLESDPTVIYGISDFDGNLTRSHLRTPTPYNTYVIRGLPPGPIANPGRASIEAALFPAQTEYLFFVSKQNGTHFFSTTFDEHNQAVRTYQLRRR
jgi:UPF0755 protein